jgi:cytidine deaminase
MHRLTTTHAEIDAINNLMPLARNKKLKKINILVIKTTHTGKIGSSKPCLNCLINLSTLPEKKGYVVKNIIYSNVNEQLEKHTLNDLIKSNNHHITKFYRRLSDNSYKSSLNDLNKIKHKKIGKSSKKMIN